MKMNKNIVKLILSLLVVITLNSCQEMVTREEYDNSMMELLNAEGLKRDSLERMYIATLDEIDGNLDAIREKQGLLILGPNSNADFVVPKKNQILNNIAMINMLLEDNKKKISSLEKSLSKYKSGKQELIKSIELAKQKIANQELEIKELKESLVSKEIKIEELNALVLTQNNKIDELYEQNKKQELKLNTSYFAYGTYKELKQKQIVRKEGGFLGINKVKVLNENLNKNNFVEIDKTKTFSIPVMGKKPSLITEHPKDSYQITSNTEDIAVLNIKNPEAFWSVSQFLVVEVH